MAACPKVEDAVNRFYETILNAYGSEKQHVYYLSIPPSFIKDMTDNSILRPPQHKQEAEQVIEAPGGASVMGSFFSFFSSSAAAPAADQKQQQRKTPCFDMTRKKEHWKSARNKCCCSSKPH